MQYYPNPVDEILTISSDKKVSQIMDYNNEGQFVQELINTNTIELSKLSSGVYIIKTLIEDRR